MQIDCRSRQGIQLVVVTAQIVCLKQWPREFNKQFIIKHIMLMLRSLQ
jgi:hypothetical protein